MKMRPAARPATGVLTAVIALALACAAPVRAHEVGATQVFISLKPDASYEIVLVTDPDALLDRLQILSGRPPVSGDRDTRLGALAPTLLEHLHLSFDGVSTQPVLTPVFTPVPAAVSLPTNSTGPRAAVVLTGPIPPGARSLLWQSTFLYGAYPLTIRADSAAAPVVQWIQGSQPGEPVTLTDVGVAVGGGSTAWRYLHLGFTHILPGGLDHVLFVLGLFLLSARTRDVLLQVSAFTVAHSVTLGLSLYGVFSLPSSVVEPLIALSIAYVAVENVMVRELGRLRLALVFAFGLLHGLGFAGALAETGLPHQRILAALFSFNVGVEVGQLAVVALAFGAALPWRDQPALYRRFVSVPASVAIALVGVWWTAARLLS